MCFLFGVKKGNMTYKTECIVDIGSSPIRENIIYNGWVYVTCAHDKLKY